MEFIEGMKWSEVNSEEMANLSSLVHELRERIAATSSTPPTTTTATSPPNDDALELRFRSVLPNLLHTYVVPSPSGTLSHTQTKPLSL